jgi:hypothetical protein
VDSSAPDPLGGVSDLPPSLCRGVTPINGVRQRATGTVNT